MKNNNNNFITVNVTQQIKSDSITSKTKINWSQMSHRDKDYYYINLFLSIYYTE